MPQRVSDVMTVEPVSLAESTNIHEAARAMRDYDIGDVVVLRGDGSLRGIVTDRDIVVRGIAEGADPRSATLEEICSDKVVTVAPDDPVATAVKAMEDHAIRRLPVVENGNLVGILSIGDLAIARDPESALGQISAASPNN